MTKGHPNIYIKGIVYNIYINTYVFMFIIFTINDSIWYKINTIKNNKHKSLYIYLMAKVLVQTAQYYVKQELSDEY